MIKKQYKLGFTLIEMALVLVIVSLLIIGSIVTLKSQNEQVRYVDSRQFLSQIKLALLSFNGVNSYLPCPDIDRDGVEDRAVNGACTGKEGTVPYRDIGLRLADVRDGFSNLVRYVVNEEATVIESMQDAGHSASYFCNAVCSAGSASAGVLPVFQLTTPPVAGNAGLGNYNVCSEEASLCNNSAQMAYESLSVILVAANKRGGINCNERGNPEVENCDGDALFWQGSFAEMPAVSGFFDDEISGLSGYEIKSHFLKTHPNALFDSSLGGGTPPGSGDVPVLPSGTFDTTISGNFNDSGDFLATNGDDSLEITGDLNAKLNLKNGDNTLQIGGNQNDALDTGTGNDIVWILGNAQGAISLGQDDDNLTINGDLNGSKTLKAEGGDDFVYIQGNVNNSVDMGPGNDSLKIDGMINANLYGGSGDDTLYVDMLEQEWHDSGYESRLNSFEVVQFSDGSSLNL
ncbi:prepilin-type N-terminal cleavage/methylation domain-containing protein [Hydrogenovibrio sp. 3SP14C1]|uniref:type II secretion system protein n=1 Tax=Hydrogenovibrio sp. 3SP14C1 TaxID=3038774 RepID=UPI0024174085|nr:prepilin-type N-terminal cleavage/methylation domain-containing protein [Hydrogenovibrio sp. 3SP14C1]MDG4811704.1 prepilin-type N-terminal cleavage/methylation domain-containing protein [Hydrogenovibrio sp. 3SP14C1]